MLIIGKGASWFGLFIGGITVLALPTSAAVWYVDKDAPPGGDGTTWATAFTEIQPAIDAAHTDSGGDVWVAEGVYDEVRSGSGGSLDLQEAVAIYGGFQGDETEREARDPNLHLTIIDGSESWAGNNARVVVRAAANSAIDGFTLEGGNFKQLSCSSSNVSVNNCIFYGATGPYGGAIEAYSITSLTIRNTRFEGSFDSDVVLYSVEDVVISRCTFGPNGRLLMGDMSGVIEQCLFAGHDSSAVLMSPCRPPGLRFDKCIFRDNTSDHGAAVYYTADEADFYLETTTPLFVNCVFAGNEALPDDRPWYDSKGGAIYINIVIYFEVDGDYYEGDYYLGEYQECYKQTLGGKQQDHSYDIGICPLYFCPPSFVNCTFSGNRAERGGAIYFQYESSVKSVTGSHGMPITNCIFWDNGPEPIKGYYENLAALYPDIFTYSIIEGGFPGTFILDMDPRFRDPASGDYRLRRGSPAIDHGRDASTAEFGEVTDDFLGCPRGYDGDGLGPATGDGSDYDIGAYEYVPGCSAEGEGEGEGQPPVVPYTADQDQDGQISLGELLRVIQFYFSGGFHCADDPGSTEDGYEPGPGVNHSCGRHASDYDGGPDWTINLHELLRVIQFYNIGGYHACPGEGTEDGFCPELA